MKDISPARIPHQIGPAMFEHTAVHARATGGLWGTKLYAGGLQWLCKVQTNRRRLHLTVLKS